MPAPAHEVYEVCQRVRAAGIPLVGDLQRLLRECGGNVTKAAQLAGKERRALGKLLKRYQIGRRRTDSETLTPA